MSFDERLTRALKILAIIGLSVALAWVVGAFLHRVIAVVIVVSGAVFFSYLIYPLVRRFSRRMPRWLAIVCVYALLAVLIGAVMSFIGPKLGSEARSLGQDFPSILQQAQNRILDANTALLTAVPIEARESAANIIESAGASLQKNAGAIAGQALTILLSLASIMTAFVIIPVMAFYILMDTDRLRLGFLRMIPAAQQSTALDVLRDIDVVMGGFIRGQIIVGATVAVLVTVMLLLLRVKYALLIGVFAGVVDIIPYLGAIAGAVPAVILAALSHGLGWALLVIGGFVLINQMEGHIIAPTVVGQRVGLKPFMVIVAILIGAELGGILGMFVAVPVAGVIKALLTRFLPPAPDERSVT